MLNHTRDEALQTDAMFREILPKLKIVPISNASLLGAPLTVESISAVIREDLERMSSRLRLIKNHQAFVLLNILSPYRSFNIFYELLRHTDTSPAFHPD